MKVTFLLLFVSDVSKYFFDCLSKEKNINLSVICFFKNSLDDTSNRKLYYNNFIFDYWSNKEKADSIIEHSDVIVYGNAPRSIISKLRKNILLIRFSERIYKTPYVKSHFLHDLFSSIYNNWKPFRKYPPVLFAIGGYTYGDYAKFHAYHDRSYRFAYLGEFNENISLESLLPKHKNDFFNMLWVGSMDYDKKLLDVLKIIKELRNEDFSNFKLTIIGDGTLRNSYHKFCVENGIDSNVSFVGNVSSNELNNYILRSQIFIASGGRMEGFNCTILRAFNYGAIVTSNIACGSSPDLIKDKENGFVFDTFDGLKNLFKSFLNGSLDYERKKTIVEKALKTVSEDWNSQVAASRLSVLLQNLLNFKDTPFNDGVFSKSICDKNWVRKFETD